MLCPIPSANLSRRIRVIIAFSTLHIQTTDSCSVRVIWEEIIRRCLDDTPNSSTSLRGATPITPLKTSDLNLSGRSMPCSDFGTLSSRPQKAFASWKAPFPLCHECCWSPTRRSFPDEMRSFPPCMILPLIQERQSCSKANPNLFRNQAQPAQPD